MIPLFPKYERLREDGYQTVLRKQTTTGEWILFIVKHTGGGNDCFQIFLTLVYSVIIRDIVLDINRHTLDTNQQSEIDRLYE